MFAQMASLEDLTIKMLASRWRQWVQTHAREFRTATLEKSWVKLTRSKTQGHFGFNVGRKGGSGQQVTIYLRRGDTKIDKMKARVWEHPMID